MIEARPIAGFTDPHEKYRNDFILPLLRRGYVDARAYMAASHAGRLRYHGVAEPEPPKPERPKLSLVQP